MKNKSSAQFSKETVLARRFFDLLIDENDENEQCAYQQKKAMSSVSFRHKKR